MDSIGISEYIILGQLHWYLAQLPYGVVASGDNGVRREIERFRESVESANLNVTLRAGYKLWKISDELEQIPEDSVLLQEKVNDIRQVAHQLESTMIAEANGMLVYTLTEKRIATPERLLREPNKLVTEDALQELPLISARDFICGCQCISFDMGTAAAFHLLRCLEGTLKQYYVCIIKRGRLKKKQMMWGPMIKALREKKTNKPPKELLDHLDNIWFNFRNPISHPSLEYTVDESQDLLGVCIDVINRIVKTTQWRPANDCYNAMSEDGEE